VKNSGFVSTQRSNDNIRALFQKSQENWDQARIVFDIELQETKLDDALQKAVASQQFGKLLPSLPADDSALHIFFVQTLGGPNGIAIGPSLALVSDRTTVNDFRATAHEIGHLLGLGHTSPDRSRLLFRGTNGTKLISDEIVTSRMRASVLEGSKKNREYEHIDITASNVSADCPDNFTALQTGGPYYKSGSPNRQSLIEKGIVGEKIMVTGFVFDGDCNPISNAWIDFWQTDGNGNYDNQGYRLRGYQYTNNEGRYVLETVMPAQYSSRPPHIHLKLQAKKDGPILTSQLYFPRQSKNTTDTIFNSSLLVSMSDDGRKAEYNFKVDTK